MKFINLIFSIFVIIFKIKFYNTNEIHCISSKLNENCTVPIELSDKNEQKTLESICDLLKNKNDSSNLIISKIQVPYVVHNDIYFNNHSIEHVCEIKNYDLFGWIPFVEFQKYTINQIEKDFSYVVKSINFTNEKSLTEKICILNSTTQKCKFLCNSSLVTKLDNNFNILIKLIPTRFEIHNVNFGSVENVAVSNKSPVANTTVKNIENAQRDILVIIHYRSMERVVLNSQIFNNITTITQKSTPIKFEYKQNLVDLSTKGVGNFLKMSKYNFSINLPPENEIFVQLIGQWEKSEYSITANLLIFYGENILKRDAIDSKVFITKIINPEPIYGESTKIKNIIRPQHPILVQKQLLANTESNQIIESSKNIESKEVYPGFRPYFVIGCLIVGITAFIIFGNMCRIIYNEKKVRQVRKTRF